MSYDIDDDDFDSDYLEPPPVFPGRRRSSAGTTNIISEADKKEAEALARKGAAQQRERLCRSVICGLVLIAVVALLILFTVKTLLAPELEGTFTEEKRDTARTTPRFNTSNDVSTANRSDAQLDAFEHTVFTSDPDVQSGPFPLKDRDEHLFCGTEDCKSLVSFLNTVLSRKRDTCGRLYDQVCSRWARSHRSLAETRGRYSVDDAVLDAYRQRVSRLLQDPAVLHADQRSFYADCVNGRLLTEQDIKDIANDITLPDEGWNPETFAKAVARMSQIGVSPFFDIFVKESNDLFSANLRFLDPTRVYRANGNNKQNCTRSKEKSNSTNSTANVNRSNSIAFFSALERLICQGITEMSGFNKSCVPTADIAVQAPWQYEWYTSTGPKLLAESVASMLEDLSMYSKALEEKILMRTSSRAIPASEEERTARCLRFIDQHDPTLIPQIITTYFGLPYQYAAQKTFTRLKATLDRNIPKASAIKIAFIAPEASRNNLILIMHRSDLYGRDTASNVSRLRKFLVGSTWKRWTGVLTSQASSLSTTPTLSGDHSLVHVPPGVFNLTKASDKSLQALSLARVGPRILRALFSLPHLSDELKRTQFSQCVSGRRQFVYRAGGSRTFRHGKRIHSSAGWNIGRRDMGPYLDLEEMASFYLSLLTYRALVGEAVAIPGTELDSDSLFLLYYVFDNCQVEVKSKATNPGRQRTRYVRGLHYPSTQDDSTDQRRLRVDSVAAMFGDLLLEKCQGISELSSCEMESGEPF